MHIAVHETPAQDDASLRFGAAGTSGLACKEASRLSLARRLEWTSLDRPYSSRLTLAYAREGVA
jgi:hypothetical protein